MVSSPTRSRSRGCLQTPAEVFWLRTRERLLFTDSLDADPPPSSANFDVAQQSNSGISHDVCFSRRANTENGQSLRILARITAQEPATGRRGRETIESDGNKNHGAEEGTRTPTPLRVHGPEPCASANSATSASDFS
jgi:hypothetical protein